MVSETGIPDSRFPGRGSNPGSPKDGTRVISARTWLSVERCDVSISSDWTPERTLNALLFVGLEEISYCPTYAVLEFRFRRMRSWGNLEAMFVDYRSSTTEAVYVQGVSKKLHVDIPNVTMWQVLRKHLYLKAYKHTPLSINIFVTLATE
jgi:hypothetical protein